MWSDFSAIASIKIENLDSKSGILDHPVHQALQSDFVNLRLYSFNRSSAVLVQGDGKECLIAVRIQFHPCTCHQLSQKLAIDFTPEEVGEDKGRPRKRGPTLK